MGEFTKTILEILSTLLPDSDVGKLLALLLIVFLALVLTGRFELKWIGIGIRHVFRWLRCKFRDKHHYSQDGIGWINFDTGHHTGTFVCRVCGKVLVIK